MSNNEKAKLNLISVGIDTKSAEILIENGFNKTKIQKTSKKDLLRSLSILFIEEDILGIKEKVSRKPIPKNLIQELIQKSDWKCCICNELKLIQPVVIHHIEEYHISQNNDYKNLIITPKKNIKDNETIFLQTKS